MKRNNLLDGKPLYTRAECTGRGSIVPKSPGAYAWYFDRIPQGVPTEGCHRIGNWILLYVGISPIAPPKNGKPPSGGNIRKRISTHFSRDAEGSTLRRTLGILLAEESGFPLRRVGSGKRITLTHAGEQALDRWLEQHARVCWVEHPQPWTLEERMFEKISLPLNLKGNDHHPFYQRLRQLRADAVAEARTAAIASQKGATRQPKGI